MQHVKMLLGGPGRNRTHLHKNNSFFKSAAEANISIIKNCMKRINTLDSESYDLFCKYLTSDKNLRALYSDKILKELFPGVTAEIKAEQLDSSLTI